MSTTGDAERMTAAESATATPPPGVFAPAYRLISVAVIAMVTIVAFEFMAISTAMPAAAEELGAVRSYGLAFSVMLTGQLLGIVLAGVWSDRSGPMPGLVAGELLFAGGAAICGLAGSFPVLLVGRAVTGLGAGLVVVVLYVVIGRVYPTELRPRVFAWVSAAWVLPSLIGAPLSGWLTTAFTWRLVFWVVVPPALLTLAMILSQRRAIARTGDTESDPDERASHRRDRRRRRPRRPRRGPACSSGPTTRSGCSRGRPAPRSSASSGCSSSRHGCCPAARCGWRPACRR